MALSAIALCARALIKLGANPITSFSDGSVEAGIAGALFPSIRDALLSQYGWGFATTSATLARLAEGPQTDYAYAYQLPTGFLRALSAGSGTQSRGLNYRIAKGKLETNAEDVTLTYLFAPAEEDFPPYFDAAIIAKLSAEFCIPITENTQRAEALYKLAEAEFAKARQVDAQQDTPNRINDFSLINARG